jgi:hypothetical protein
LLPDKDGQIKYRVHRAAARAEFVLVKILEFVRQSVLFKDHYVKTQNLGPRRGKEFVEIDCQAWDAA